MKILSVLLLLCCVSSAEKHSLEYSLSTTYGFPDVPEFMATAAADGVEFGYYDSNIKTAELFDWAKEMMRNKSDHLKRYSELCLGYQHSFKALIVDIMKSLNQSGGVHILRLRGGCEWDEETGETAGSLKFGYDGEDFMTLDLQALTWTALKPEAPWSKLIWDSDKYSLNVRKDFYLEDCPILLKEYWTNGRKFLQGTILPSVSFMESPSSSVSCVATGFYPDRAAMFWRKDGEEVHEGVDLGEILPNKGGTFQMRADLNLTSVRFEDWEKYECVFQLSGVDEDIVTRLDGRYGSIACYGPSAPLLLITLGAAAGLLLLSVCIVGFIMWRKKKNRYQAVQHA